MNNSYINSLRPHSWADVWIRSGWRVQTNVVTGSSRTLSPTGKIVAAGDEVECLLEARRVATGSGWHHAIILLHGMGRTRHSFRQLEAQLPEEGFAVANIGYASLSDSSETHVRRLKTIVDGLAEDGARQISFVGHSLLRGAGRRLTGPSSKRRLAMTVLGQTQPTGEKNGTGRHLLVDEKGVPLGLVLGGARAKPD